MWFSAQSTRELALARGGGPRQTMLGGAAPATALLALRSAKSEQGSVAGAPDAALRALADVIPAGIIAIYAGAVSVVQQVALAAGGQARADVSAAMAKAGRSEAEIASALAPMPVESAVYAWARVSLFIVGLACAGVLSWRAASAGNAASEHPRTHVVAEPLTAMIAFAGWAFAAPGTLLAPFLNATSVLVGQTVIAAVAVLSLAAAGGLVLTRPSDAARGEGTHLSDPGKTPSADQTVISAEHRASSQPGSTDGGADSGSATEGGLPGEQAVQPPTSQATGVPIDLAGQTTAGGVGLVVGEGEVLADDGGGARCGDLGEGRAEGPSDPLATVPLADAPTPEFDPRR